MFHLKLTQWREVTVVKVILIFKLHRLSLEINLVWPNDESWFLLFLLKNTCLHELKNFNDRFCGGLAGRYVDFKTTLKHWRGWFWWPIRRTTWRTVGWIGLSGIHYFSFWHVLRCLICNRLKRTIFCVSLKRFAPTLLLKLWETCHSLSFS